jgi:hypothetical protein
MKYEQELDKKTRKLGQTSPKTGHTTSIHADLYSYNCGPEKLHLYRTNEQGQSFKIGRMTRQEVADIAPILVKWLVEAEVVDDYDGD